MQYIEPYNTYIFTAENIFVGQNLRLPAAGNFFGASGKKGEGVRRKINVVTPLEMFRELYEHVQFASERA